MIGETTRTTAGTTRKRHGKGAAESPPILGTRSRPASSDPPSPRTQRSRVTKERRESGHARVVVIAVAQLAVSAELYVEWLRAQRPIKPGEPHAVLASAGDGQADHRRVLTTAPRAISGYRWHSARHSRLSAAPRPHRVRRLLSRRAARAPGPAARHE